MDTKEQNGDSILNRSQTERENAGRLGFSSQGICLVFFGLALVSFGYLLFTPYVYDDVVVIRDNTLLRSLSSLREVWAGHVDQNEIMDGTHRPIFLTWISIVGQILSFSPFVLRFFSIALHSLNAFLIFRICEKYFRWTFLLSIFVSLLFLLHPIQTANIGLVWKQSDIWIAFLSLISILTIEKNPFYYLFFFVMALGIKENALILPLLVLVFDPFYEKSNRKLRISILGSSVLLGYLYFHYLFPSIPHGEIIHSVTSTKLEYFATQIHVLPMYFLTLVNPFLLAADRNIQIQPVTFLTYFSLISLAAFLAVLFLLNFRKKWPWITAVLLGTFWLTPTSSFYPLSLLYDETRMYLAVACVGIIFANLFQTLNAPLSLKPKKLILGSFIFCLAALTVFQTLRWKSEETLWSAVLDVDPFSPRAHYHVGLAAQDARALDDAEIHYRKAVELSPELYSAILNLGIVLGQKGDLDGAKEQFIKLLQTKKDKYISLGHYHLGLDSYYRKKLKEAQKHFEESLKYDASSGNGYLGQAILAASQKKNDLAVAKWKQYVSSARHPEDRIKKIPKELKLLVGEKSVR